MKSCVWYLVSFSSYTLKFITLNGAYSLLHINYPAYYWCTTVTGNTDLVKQQLIVQTGRPIGKVPSADEGAEAQRG